MRRAPPAEPHSGLFQQSQILPVGSKMAFDLGIGRLEVSDKREGNLQRNLFVSAESAEVAALRSSLASRTESDGPVASIFPFKARKDVVFERFALTLDPTENERAEIYEAVLFFVQRFDIRPMLFAPISAVYLLVGVADRGFRCFA